MAGQVGLELLIRHTLRSSAKIIAFVTAVILSADSVVISSVSRDLLDLDFRLKIAVLNILLNPKGTTFPLNLVVQLTSIVFATKLPCHVLSSPLIIISPFASRAG